MANIYDIAFANIYGVGPAVAREIMENYSSTEELFSESRKCLEAIFKNRTRTIDDILNKTMFAKCEKEMEFMEKYNIRCFFFKDSDYPKKLLQIPDMPICFYYQGTNDLKTDRMIAVVGTRNATKYGKEITEQIVSELKHYNVGIVSGLAYGIDTAAHHRSIMEDIPTFGVLGHGLDMIYPKQNFDIAKTMIEKGGLITEFMTETKPIPQNFPRRNRIIAGLCDATICVEAAKKGGALLTADLANQYNREVFAVPGRIGDNYSEGCNYLIRTTRANILHNVTDIAELMNWDEGNQLSLFKEEKTNAQLKMLANLSKDEKSIYEYIAGKKEANIDDISIECSLNPSILAGCLLNLELEGIIKCLPGKMYRIS